MLDMVDNYKYLILLCSNVISLSLKSTHFLLSGHAHTDSLAVFWSVLLSFAMLVIRIHLPVALVNFCIYILNER